MEHNYIDEQTGGGVPIKTWTRGVPVEDAARRQLQNAARLPFVFKHVAAMPDVHFGIGATVGSVIPTQGRDHPGRGRRRHRLRHDGGARPRSRAERPAGQPGAAAHRRSSARCRTAAPQRRPARPRRVGRTRRRRRRRRGRRSAAALRRASCEQAPARWRRRTTVKHLGTLGTGNHFIEVCLDEADARLVHAALGLARRRQPHRHATSSSSPRRTRCATTRNLPDRDLAYFAEGTQHFGDYVAAVGWAQALRGDATAS